MLLRRLRYLPYTLILLSGFCTAQKITPKQILFTGYNAASQADLLATSGLHNGVSLDAAAIQTAAQKLDATGMFAEVRFTFDGQTLSYLLKPLQPTLPAQFDNFVWWSDAALAEELHKRVPLFHGRVAVSSGLEQQIVTALTALVREKGISATVQALPEGPLGQAPTVDRFVILTPDIKISQFVVEGASPLFAPKVAADTKAAINAPYSEADSSTELSALALMPYGEAGYLDAKLLHLHHGTPSLQGGSVSVPFSADVVEGSQYHIGQLRWAGSPYLSQTDFLKISPLKAGTVPARNGLDAMVKALQSSFSDKGYAMAEVSMKPTMHTAEHLVDYDLSVNPGPIYHMGNLQLVNLNPQQQADVLSAWTMRKGDLYKQSYISSFLKNNSALHFLDGYFGSYKTIAKSSTQSVDVIVTFMKR
ncbi:MAG: POTRA domain-containing protein [Acidobacteriaceae bacterium]